MLRGYRGIFIALGLILAHPNAIAQPKQGGANERSAEALEAISSRYDEQAKRSESSRETEPCEQGDDKRYSDLCAQWKAADSAQLAAWLSGASFAAVLAALYLAFRSNWIARDTAKRQLRAYITVEPLGVYQRDENGNIVVPIALKNAGQTPAYHVTIHSWFQLSDTPTEFDSLDATRDIPAFDPSEITMNPAQQQAVYTVMPFSPMRQVMEGIARKQTAIIHFGHVTYRDAFDAWRHTWFAHYHWGPLLSDGESKRCRLGNHAD